MPKIIKFHSEAREKIKKGIEVITDAVSVTLGPKGRNVIIAQKYGSPQVTKDGVSVAKAIELQDPVENLGAQLIKEAASRTVDTAGDGTSTATVLSRAIFVGGLKSLAAGANPMDLKRGIDKAVSAVTSSLRAESKPVRSSAEITQVATISANNIEKIGKMISDAMDKVGDKGVVTIEEAKGRDTKVEVEKGMKLDRGYISPYLINNPEKMKVELDQAHLLLTDKKLSSMKELIPSLEQVSQTGKPLLIIAEDIDGEALATLILNKIRGVLKIAAIKAPGFGDRKKAMLEDIAVLTGATVISEERGYKLENITLDYLGQAEKIHIDKESTIIVNGAGDKSAIEARVNQIQAQIDDATSDYDREKFQERLAKLAGGVAVIRIGAATETELKNTKDLVDDALHATRAAVDEGVVPGGGVALIRAIDSLKDVVTENADQATGVDIVKVALEIPLRTIVANAGEEGALVVQKVKEGEKDFGYNVRTGVYEAFYKSGVIDPTKVVRHALENAASAASMLLTSECAIAEEPEKEKEIPPTPPMGGGMM